MGMMDFETAVIGAGPGGLVSALYLRRFLRNTLLASGGPPRASWIPRTHNLLGYRGGVSGASLLAKLHRQLDDIGIERAVGFFRVQQEGEGFLLEDGDGKRVATAKKVILATGVRDVEPPLENLVSLRRSGLLRYCPVCDAFEHCGKKLGVFAQDDHGFKTAMFLSRYTKTLTVFVPPESHAAAFAWEEQCRPIGVKIKIGRIQRAWEKGNGGGLRVAIANEETGREDVSDLDAAYVALGSRVNDFAFAHLRAVSREKDTGCVETGSHQELGVKGLFAVGDCVVGLDQIAVAAGHAAIAATRLHNELREEEGETLKISGDRRSRRRRPDGSRSRPATKRSKTRSRVK